MRILVDVDDVIADWGGAYDRALDTFGSDAAGIPRYADRRVWDLTAGRTEREREIIRKVMRMPGFYALLGPVPGAKAALKQAVKDGHDVRLVTAPYISNPTCASDKLAWVDRVYGGDWASRVVLTSDKTVVHGDILIDDKPVITGSMVPSWTQVVFDRPWNRDALASTRIYRWEGLGFGTVWGDEEWSPAA